MIFCDQVAKSMKHIRQYIKTFTFNFSTFCLPTDEGLHLTTWWAMRQQKHLRAVQSRNGQNTFLIAAIGGETIIQYIHSKCTLTRIALTLPHSNRIHFAELQSCYYSMNFKHSCMKLWTYSNANFLRQDSVAKQLHHTCLQRTNLIILLVTTLTFTSCSGQNVVYNI